MGTFLSKPSFKIAAKGNGKLHGPLACSFEQIVRRPQEPRSDTGSWSMIVPAISGYTTCGVQTNGTLWCWGDNQYGQLGQGTTDASTHSSPVQVGSATTGPALP